MALRALRRNLDALARLHSAAGSQQVRCCVGADRAGLAEAQFATRSIRTAASMPARPWHQSTRGIAAEAVLAPATDAMPGVEPVHAGPPDLHVPLYNWAREPVGTAVLPGEVFNAKVRRDLLHRVVRWQLAKRQQGTHKTKTRGEVRGGGRKPWKQKGSGKARAGTIRAPHWRGGGVAHGPVVRSHEHDLQRKVRRQGLACALSAKASEGRLLVMDSLELPEGKTVRVLMFDEAGISARALDERLDTLLADAPRRSVLMIDSGKSAEDGGLALRRAAANLPWVDVLPQEGANVYAILQRDVLVMTRGAAAAVAARTMEPVHRTPARLRRDVVPEPMLHPLVRQKLEAAAQSLANQAEGKVSSAS